MAGFLANANLSGKIIAPFCTHGGGGLASCERDITGIAAGARVLESYVSYEGGENRTDISKWLERLKLNAN